MTTPGGNQQWSKRGSLRGPAGEPGTTPTLTVGTVTAGTTPAVTRRGTDAAPVLDFTLPKGDAGAKGDPGPKGDKGDAGPRGNKIMTVALATAGTVPEQTDSIVGDLLLDPNTGDLYRRDA